MKIAFWASLALAAFFGTFMLLTAGWERPPIKSVQTGYRGLALEQNINPRREATVIARNQLPDVIPEASPEGPRASAVYENVQVLGHLSEEQFVRVMLAITDWVSRDEGCNYCHVAENLADDSLYPKRVARRMLQMTAHTNLSWQKHVRETGVTCYTCHRGQPVPEKIWFSNPGPVAARGPVGYRAGQNIAAASVGTTSLPFDPFPSLLNDDNVRVISTSALPSGDGASIKRTERTYALMMHMSRALGQNCTFCHNSRSFFDWNQSAPQRTSAWYGIRMVRDLNTNYLVPLTPTFPPHRLGPLGDVAKINCGTCHQGVNKPLLGASMLRDYPELNEVKQ
ncbi:MAG: photosynthetic reaction center cytochrome c subunit [Rhodospirillales bacterium]|nr:photosynthetic reaction center cytochrome c subunit [Rhodospirillales bacterium]